MLQLKRNRARNARIVLGKEGRITFRGWHFLGARMTTANGGSTSRSEPPHQEKPGILGADASHVWNCSAGGIIFGIRVMTFRPLSETTVPSTSSKRKAQPAEKSERLAPEDR